MDTIIEGERRGWVKLFRKFRDNRFFRDSYMVHLINYLLINANYEDKEAMVNGTPLTIKRGHLLFGLNAAHRDTGISIKKLRRRMAVLEAGNFLGRKRAGKYSIVTICNYDLYQGSPHDDGQSEGQAEGKHRATPKEVIGSSPRKKGDPRVKEFFNYWDETFLQETGQHYVFTYGKDGKLVKDILQVHDLSTLRHAVKDFFRDEQCKRRGPTIGIFFQEVNRLIGSRGMDPLEQAKREMFARRMETP